MTAERETTIPRTEPTQDDPLSSAQLSMWLTAQDNAQRDAYVVPMHYRVGGPVDAEILRQALDMTVARHESLRTIFQARGDSVRQVVLNEQHVDWSATTTADEDLPGTLDAFFRRGFDLETGPLFRAALITTPSDNHHLLMAAHHIVMDAWSVQVVVEEVQRRYSALVAGEDAHPEPLSIQYRDYARWEQARLTSRAGAARQYWQDRFAVLPEPLALPTDRPTPSRRDFSGATVRSHIPSTTTQMWKDYARAAGVSPFVPLLAAVRILLHRYSGQRDIVLGVPFIDRPVAELYDQVGCYLNTLAVRDTVPEAATFDEVVAACNRSLREAVQHGEVPFSLVVQDCGASAERFRNPLFDVMVSYLPYGDEDLTDSALPLERVAADNGRSKLDLTIFVEEHGRDAEIAVEYSSALFDRERIEGLIDHLLVLLQGALSDPDHEVESLPIMSPEQTRTVLSGFNATCQDYDLTATVVAQFESQARRVPRHIAVSDGVHSLTYEELERQTAAVAARLVAEHGVCPGNIVALHIPRSIDLVVAVWGVLRCGATYLPLNLNDPAERVATVIQDSDARLVLTAGSGRVFDHDAVDVRTLAATESTPGPLVRPSVGITSDMPAYCIYTSGSTGTPKGVLIRHDSLTNRLKWMADELKLTSDDVFLQKTTASFDVSVWELVVPFTLGAKLAVLPAGAEGDPEAIDRAIVTHGVSVVHFVPSMLSAYLDETASSLPGVRACICSGEALDRDLADRFAAANSVTVLWNYYGPTEATIDVSSVKVGADGPVTIGRPCANTQLFILDPRDQPLPPGVPGNLCIAGIQVASGYLNRPELTADKFVSLPHLASGPVYRTGDRAAWTRDGQIQYLGRDDHQVKIRGYRIELGDIESTLVSHPAVERAIVLATGRGARTSLFAFVVWAEPGVEGLVVDDGTLRTVVREQLPAYMVPSRFFAVPEIPVTRNGKADRNALFALAEAALGASQSPFDNPQGPTVVELRRWERELHGIWSDLLPPGRIDRSSEFFDMGGHSLLILKLRGQILERLSIEVDIAELFQHTTIQAQAELLEASTSGSLQRFGAHHLAESSPLSPDQERMWFLHLLAPESTAYNIRTLADIRGELRPDLLQEAFLRLQQRHEILRVTYGNGEDGPYQLAHPHLPLRFLRLDFQEMDEQAASEAVAQQIAAEETQAFDLTTQPPLRATLMTLNGSEHRLLITLHHIASDGWSMGILEEELAEIYEALRENREPALAPLRLQYRDYAAEMRSTQRVSAQESDVAWWAEHLAGVPRLDLPLDVVPSPVAHPVAVRTSGVLGADTTRRLREAHSGTEFEVATAALALLLSRLSGQRDVTIGFPVTNRPEAALEQLIGLFLNTLILRVDVPFEETFDQLLERVRHSLHEAYRHQGAPFAAVVERINPERSADRPPLFDVMINDVGNLQANPQLRGVQISFSDEMFEPEAKVPFSFYLSRRSPEDEDALRVELVHRPDLATAERGRVLVNQYLSLLGQVALDPTRPIRDYSLVDPTDGDPLAEELGAPTFPTVLELVRGRAVEQPDAIAVALGAQHLTYRDLIRVADEVATQLLSSGVRPGEVVAVTGSRSPAFLAAMLGVLSSGAVFLPIEPFLPPGRIERLLTVGRPVMCIRTETAVAPIAGVPDMLFDAARITSVMTGDPDREPSDLPLSTHEVDAPAYVFFTSGTTGLPKAVLGRHQALSHFLMWEKQAIGLSGDDRVAQLTSLSFDVMLRDSLVALVSGATTVMPAETDTIGGSAVLNWLDREGITVLHTVPTVLRSWLQDAPTVSPASLGTVVLAGEPLPGALVDSLRSQVPGCAVFNLYGPTETTLAKTAYRVPDGPARPGTQQISRPLPQCQALVMSQERVCGIGELGEIVIRTPFRTLGYLNDPAATDAVFTVNPGTGDPRDRIYHTGDLGRLRPDGGLDIFGRMDHQVKLNGVRVQLAEIEQVLLQHEAVDSAVVIAHDFEGEPALVAYAVVGRDTGSGSASASDANQGDVAAGLRAYLRAQLPIAMVPRMVVVIPRIPVTPNGKLDRSALPRPTMETSGADNVQGPGDEGERAVLSCWKQALGKPVAGVDLDFFALGGNSLKLLRLFSLLNERFPGKFRIAELFIHTTIQQQARLVTDDSAATTPNTRVQDYDF